MCGKILPQQSHNSSGTITTDIMKILITGGTGFVGSHVSRQLMAAGHDVRLLVRDSIKAKTFFSNLGEPIPDLAQGDITDATSISRALDGCQSVVHCAAATPIKTDSVEQLFSINVEGLKNTVELALASGVESVVCISSITAIFNKDASKVTADAEPVPSTMPYGQSKVEGELFLRQLQAEGAPIAIVYPGAIIGPDDPGFSDTFFALKHRLENGFRIFGDGGMQHVDVRDLSAFIASLAVKGERGRFVLPGVYRKWSEWADIIEGVSGFPLQRIPAQGWKLRLVGRAMDFVRHFKTVPSPISAETMRYATLWPDIKNTDALQTHGIVLRDPRETFRDSIAWMIKAGHLDANKCSAIRS